MNRIISLLRKVAFICVFVMTFTTDALATGITPFIYINEIMQSNINTVFAEMDFPDSWVELYNPTEEDISICQFYIGSSPNYVENYRINEDVIIHPGGYTLIYLDKEAKGKHTDFRLNSVDPGVLFLFNAEGGLLDSLSYPAMPAPNIAYARDADGAETWHYVNRPTPNSSNIGGGSDILLPQPVFSISGHVMTETESLTVSIPNTDLALPDDTRLYLTFDGNEPDTSAICVSARDTTFLIDKTTVVRARLISSSALCPPSHTESYIFHPRSTSIPIISLVTNDAYLYSGPSGIFSSDTLPGNTKPNYAYNWRRPLNMEYLGVAGDEPLFNQWGETGMFGNSTRSAKQKSMKLIANKRFGTKHFKGVFWPDLKPNINKQKAMCIRSCTTGSRIIEGFMQNWFGMHIQNLDYQAFTPAIVYINGEYKGFMGLREKSDEDYVWANYDKLEDIEMIETLTASKPASFKEIKDAILSETISFEEAASQIDMPNTADVTAIHIICSDTDWPYNNVSLWRPTEGEGKWRWIMKDMDMINVAFRCTDPLTFNYFKYLTNTGEPDSQEAVINQSASFIWPRVQFMGKLIIMPGFRDALVDRLMVFMGDFMRGDILQNYLEEQYEAFDSEITPSLQMLKAGGITTFQNAIQKDIAFFCERPNIVYQQICDFYHFGTVIPMTTKNNGMPVSINNISLTEGDFNGACFSDRAIQLNSGDEDTGWLVHVRSANSAVTSYGFRSSTIDICPKDYMSSDDKILNIEFEACAINEIPVSYIATTYKQNNNKIASTYTLEGKKTTHYTKYPYIIHYSDGHNKKVWTK